MKIRDGHVYVHGIPETMATAFLLAEAAGMRRPPDWVCDWFWSGARRCRRGRWWWKGSDAPSMFHGEQVALGMLIL